MYTYHTKPTPQQVEKKRAAYKRSQVLLKQETKERMSERVETDRPRESPYHIKF